MLASLTHMTHFVGKYFTYHKVRWEDHPNIRGSRIEAAVAKALGYPLTWSAPRGDLLFNIYRSADGKTFTKVTSEPLAGGVFTEPGEPNVKVFYRVTSLDRRLRESGPSVVVSAAAKTESREPVLAASFSAETAAAAGDQKLSGK
ncbi:MAG TPA: hypothetical protein PLR32_02635, partial [candidate division Zixibacteria bacterium]|nr:hypothetical protein [candidate division Zixibacteria bacterium]